jgi:CheY-like chemotaxis protein
MTHPSFKPSPDQPPRTEMADTIGGGGFATERQLDALGRVASVVAHELTNLLQILSSSLDRLAVADDPEGTAMKTVRGSIDRGTRLARQLQTFAQTAPPRLLTREIHQLMASWMPEFEDAVGPDRRLELRLRHSGSLIVDAEQLQTAIVNLLVNARDASPAGSPIILELSRPERGTGCRIAVIDHGEGMTDDVARQAVAPFFTTRPPGKGMGLGLTIARMVAESHGGTLDIDSAFGRGTTVTMYLAGGEARSSEAPGASTTSAMGHASGTHGAPAHVLPRGETRAGESRGPGAPASATVGGARSSGTPGPGPHAPGPHVSGPHGPGSQGTGVHGAGNFAAGVTAGPHVPGGHGPNHGTGSHMPGQHSPGVQGPGAQAPSAHGPGQHGPGPHGIKPPVASTTSPTGPIPLSTQPAPAPGHILVIDDEEAIAEYFRIILSAEHYDVTVVTSAHQALDRFAENPSRYDTVLLDMMLRDGSGIDLYRKFRQLRPDLPVVVCTGFSDNESLAPIRADGHDILFKPCPRGDVLRAVAKAVHRRAPEK